MNNILLASDKDQLISEQVEKLRQLKKAKNAVILAHLYQRGPVQDVADYVGDSLGLSQEAARTDAEIILFAGVHFMAETAAILNPRKKVFLADERSGCPMADMINAEEARRFKARYPDGAVVAYVNTSAEVKAESDICCTSSNAVKVVKSLPNKKILFLPDESLGKYVAEQVTDKEFLFWDGFCPTHHRIKSHHILEMKKLHPGAQVLVHPENLDEVRALADYIGSTSGILDYSSKSAAREFIVVTEEGIIHALEKQNPDKLFYHISRLCTCPNMKYTTVDKMIETLEYEANRIVVPEPVREKAYLAIDRMLKIS